MYPSLFIFSLSIPTYFLILSLVFSSLVFLSLSRAKALSLNPETTLDVYLYVLVGGFLGARLFYVFYQEPSFYLENPIEVLAFWNGGYVFFGGFLGGLFAGLYKAYKEKLDVELWLNFSAPLLSFGYTVGRLACFLNGCCYGEEHQGLFSVYIQGAMRHPAQIYAVCMELAVLTLLVSIERLKGFNKAPVFLVWMIGHGLGRMVMEHYRADPRGDLILGLTVSSFISLVLVTLGLMGLVYKIKKRF